MREVEQRQKDAKDKKLTEKVSYLVEKLGESNYFPDELKGERTFTYSDLVLKIQSYPNAHSMYEDMQIYHNDELCFRYNGCSTEIESYIPGKWEEKLEQLYNKHIKADIEARDKKLEEAELEKHRIEMSHAEAGWKAAEAALRKKFGL